MPYAVSLLATTLFALLVSIVWLLFLALGWDLIVGAAGFCFCWFVLHRFILPKSF